MPKKTPKTTLEYVHDGIQEVLRLIRTSSAEKPPPESLMRDLRDLVSLQRELEGPSTIEKALEEIRKRVDDTEKLAINNHTRLETIKDSRRRRVEQGGGV